MNDEEYFNEIYEYTLLQSTSGIWSPFRNSSDFKKSKKAFLDCLRYFIETNKLRLAKNGLFLTGTTDEQLELFRKSFPDEKRMKETENYWWYSDECPAGVVWIVDEEVEGFTTPAENGKYYFWS